MKHPQKVLGWKCLVRITLNLRKGEYMYLEQPRAFGAIAVPQVLCNNGQYDIANGFVAPCRTKGGQAPFPLKPKFMPSYNLRGVYSKKGQLSYGNCKSGYVKQMVNMPHPNAYSCFDPAELAWNKKYGIMF
jgi:hypothetical protein